MKYEFEDDPAWQDANERAYAENAPGESASDGFVRRVRAIFDRYVIEVVYERRAEE